MNDPVGRTLAQTLASEAIPLQDLREYRPMLRIVRELIGVIPNCDHYLEIWKPGFQTYNLIVPNFLNIPASILGQGAPKELVGLGMYVSSRAAECMYCSAHTCSYAIRRGLPPDVVAGNYNEVEAAVAELADGIGRVPATVSSTHIKELEQHLSEDDLEWVLLGIAMMGFLNKFMDAMGIELEEESIADVKELIEPTGWTAGKHQWDDDLVVESGGEIPKDGFGTYFRVMRQAPGAVRLESKWTRGVSGRVANALMLLEDRVGYSFPILGSLNHKRAVKAIAAVLLLNLDAERTTVGLSTKVMVGLVYAKMVGDEMLQAEMLQLAYSLAPELDTELLIDVGHFAEQGDGELTIPPGLNRVEAASILLAKAGAPSPSEINEITITTVTQHLSAQQTVEVVIWLSVLQMLHRLYAFFDAKIGLT